MENEPNDLRAEKLNLNKELDLYFHFLIFQKMRCIPKQLPV